MFDCALLRHVHQIVAIRHRYPNESILQSKVDVKSPYRRLHNATATAVAAMVLVGGYLLVALCLTFGGSPNPSQWSDLSDLAGDLANDMGPTIPAGTQLSTSPPLGKTPTGSYSGATLHPLCHRCSSLSGPSH